MSSSLKTLHFGEIEYGEADLIEFPGGLLGLEKFQVFVLVEGKEYAPFKFLQSVDNHALSLPLIDPTMVDSKYKVQLSQWQMEQIQAAQDQTLITLCIVTIPSEPTHSSVNLFAPVIINPLQRKAAQVILSDSGYSLQKPLVEQLDVSVHSQSRSEPHDRGQH